jgi:cytoskeletal protein CcmA (bactofilin family)
MAQLSLMACKVFSATANKGVYMFSKPNLTGRNDPITRKDIRAPLGSAITPPTQNVADLTTKAAIQAGSSETKESTTEPEKIDNTADNPMGARLIVGPDVKLKGAEILDCDTLVVEGRVEATMDSRVIRIADKGSFSGKVSIDIAEIHGSFEGELTARSQLIIHATGRVSGKIRYGKLVIDEGGELCGDINAISAEKTAKLYPRDETSLALSAVAG